LALVVVLILVAAKVFRRTGASGPMPLSDEAVQVLGRKSVDYRNAIHLVRCGSRLLVLGSSQTGLTPLAEITDRTEVESLAELCRTNEPPAAMENIVGWLRRIRSESDDSTDDDESEPESDPAVLRLRARLATKSPVSGPASDSSPTQEANG
jgi:flagellar biogenesis protein FliO